jgi:tetratricopeptide (TPR) repeat protein
VLAAQTFTPPRLLGPAALALLLVAAAPRAVAGQPAEVAPGAAGPGESGEAGEAREPSDPSPIDPDAAALKEVERLSHEAVTHYKAKDFAKAVAAYVKAYHLARAGRLLYNIAWIYDQHLSEPDLALDYYRRYVGAPDAEAELVEKALNRMKVIRLSAAAAPGPAGRTDGLAGPGASPRAAPPGAASRGLTGPQIGGWVLFAVGVAGLGAGGALYGLASGTHADYQASHDLDERLALRGTVRDQALIGDVLVGVGAAAALTGVILVVAGGGGAPEEQGAVEVGAHLGPDGALLTLRGSL